MEKVVSQPVQADVNPQPTPPVMKKVNFSNKKNMMLAVGAVLVVLAGVLTGWQLSGVTMGNEAGIPASVTKNATGNEAGIETAECKTEVEGSLEEGGIEGEGTHHLVRSADASKNVYLGSTVIDLQSFVGKKVKVTGQTISGKKAGWLMDVCKIKINQ